MGSGKRKYLFFDIDGTLAVGTPGAQYVPESTKLALKERATLVTANVDDDGIYKACEQLGLFD